jgi:predicted nuclease of restriction endonuclease-like (RecB) superfamily
MNFESLVGHINQVQDVLQAQAAHAINLALTARNWLVGYYIVEFEQNGEDRAKYGENLLNRLSKDINRKGFEPRSLRVYRRFYLVYPQLGTEIGSYLQKNNLLTSNLGVTSIWQAAPAILQISENQTKGIWQAAPAKLEEWATPADRLFHHMNYTCLAYLTSIEDPLKRAFYEQETIRGCWTSRELDRQVSSQYYERMGLSKDKRALHRFASKDAQQLSPREVIHNPVTLEFLELPSDNVYTESKLETTILNHLQMVLMEMGRGFCFEARQKRVLIDRDYFKADLIFYHRILKCHVIIDLKIDRFRHEYASQLNCYMNYYKHEVMQADDNPPIGLLLCTEYGETTVQYATEGLSQNLFVSKYRLQLPSEEEMRQYLLESASEADWNEYKKETEGIKGE